MIFSEWIVLPVAERIQQFDSINPYEPSTLATSLATEFKKWAHAQGAHEAYIAVNHGMLELRIIRDDLSIQNKWPDEFYGIPIRNIGNPKSKDISFPESLLRKSS